MRNDHTGILRRMVEIEHRLSHVQAEHNNQIFDDMRYLINSLHQVFKDYERVQPYCRHKPDCHSFDVVEFPKCSCGYEELFK